MRQAWSDHNEDVWNMSFFSDFLNTHPHYSARASCSAEFGGKGQEDTSWYDREAEYRDEEEEEEEDSEGWDGGYGDPWRFNHRKWDAHANHGQGEYHEGEEYEEDGEEGVEATTDVVLQQHLQSLGLKAMPESVPVLRAAFRGAAKRFHPDMVTSRSACADRFLRAQQAYAFLKDRLAER
jgi:hypothetical protein